MTMPRPRTAGTVRPTLRRAPVALAPIVATERPTPKSSAQEAIEALYAMREIARRKGFMSDEEIEAEIQAARAEMAMAA
jgi:hypothetical protein